MLIIEQKLQERMLSFVSDFVRVMSTKDKALVEECLLIMLIEAQSILININETNTK